MFHFLRSLQWPCGVYAVIGLHIRKLRLEDRWLHAWGCPVPPNWRRRISRQSDCRAHHAPNCRVIRVRSRPCDCFRPAQVSPCLAVLSITLGMEEACSRPRVSETLLDTRISTCGSPSCPGVQGSAYRASHQRPDSALTLCLELHVHGVTESPQLLAIFNSLRRISGLREIKSLQVAQAA